MKTIRIQPEEENGVLPYPFFVSENGNIGRQDFWKGKPKKLIGFSTKPVAGEMSVTLGQFIEKPRRAVGLFPIFEYRGGKWFTHTTRIENATEE